MIEIVYVLVGAALGAVAGYFVGSSRYKQGAGGDAAAELGARLAAAEAMANERLGQIASLKADIENRQLKHNEENALLLKLKPVETVLGEMQRKVADIEKQRADELAALQTSLKHQVDATEKLRGQTSALAKAMSNNQDRGKWGEIQLERIVEAAGMMNRVDFIVQGSTTDAAGIAIKPDMVVKLPGNRSIPVDSKVPFNAYLEAMSFDDMTNPEHVANRKRLLDKHVADLRGHVRTLGTKKYWEGFANAADYVVAFIPSENLLGAALEQDPTLGEFAISNNVVLATPMTLFATLQAVALTWQNTVDQEALNSVISLGKDLFARLKVVAEHANAVGKALHSAGEHYNKFVSSMERNLLTTARELNSKEQVQFGITAIPELRQIETQTNDFTKPELAIEETKLNDEPDGK